MAAFKAVIVDDRHESHHLEKAEFEQVGAEVVELRTVNPPEEAILAECRVISEHLDATRLQLVDHFGKMK